MSKNIKSSSSVKKRKRVININHDEISDDLKEFISENALECACNNKCDDDQKDFEINNSDDQLNIIEKRGKPEGEISFLKRNPSSKGDIIELENKDLEFIIFIYWKDKNSPCDLDLSVFGLGADNVVKDHCDYTKKTSFNNCVNHSGDVTSAPRGASEYIRFKLNKLKNKNEDLNKLIIQVYSYNSIAFEDLEEAMVGIGVIPEGNNKGDGPEGCYVLNAFRLSGKSKINLCGILNLGEKDSFQFIGININSQDTNLRIENNLNLILKSVYNFNKWLYSVNAPIKILERELIKGSHHNIIKYTDKSGKEKYYEKEEGEENVNFFKRVKNDVKKTEKKK